MDNPGNITSRGNKNAAKVNNFMGESYENERPVQLR